jgi:LysR family nitrogen assimilation transcriptional regulator
MDMAVIYAGSPIKGLQLQPLLTEELFFVAPAGTALPPSDDQTIPLRALATFDLLLPSRMHFLRRLIDDEFARIGVAPRITAEIESAATLRQAIEVGLGATILPAAVAGMSSAADGPIVRRIVEPTMQATISLCVTDHLPMSDQASAVLAILRKQVDELFVEGRFAGIRAPETPGIPSR